MIVCRDALEGESNNRCSKEIQQFAECFQTHLRPYGFSDEEIVKLLGWQRKKKNSQKRKPSLNVEKEGGEATAVQTKKPGEGEEKMDNEGSVDNEAPGEGGKPKVEVDQGSENGKH
eukprot:g5568.t1